MKTAALYAAFFALVAVQPVSAEILAPQVRGPVLPYQDRSPRQCAPNAPCMHTFLRVPNGKQLRTERIECAGPGGYIVFNKKKGNSEGAPDFANALGTFAGETKGPFFFAEGDVVFIRTEIHAGESLSYCSVIGFLVPVE